ncbi:MAG: hypothetical protein IT336_10970, partial [Thermomicrobiales bacterium]|nr:hypothetical protein [Thermomicrobiales bacterium]
ISQITPFGSPHGPHGSTIFSFSFGAADRDAAFTRQAKANGIHVGLRNFGVRVASHYWNSAEDADRLLAEIEGFAARDFD